MFPVMWFRTGYIDTLLYGDAADARGHLANPGKPLLFTMARLDRIKDIPDLVEWYGACEALRGQVSCWSLPAGVDVSKSSDREEQD